MKRDPSTLKSHDVLVLLKLVVLEDPAWTFDQLGDSLGLSTSEVLQGLRRLEHSHLVDSGRRTVFRETTSEFLTHAVKFFFPASPLCRTSSFAANRDASLRELLALLDAVRVPDSQPDPRVAENQLTTSLAEHLDRKLAPPPKDVVWANLSDQGAPLVLSDGAAGETTKLPAEKALAWSFAFCHEDPTLARVLPVVLHKQKARLDFRALRQWAKALKEERTLGFFLELTSELSHDRSLWRRARLLRSDYRSSPELSDFFGSTSPNPWREKLMEVKSPDVAKRWGFKMNMDLESFASHFRKFA